MSVTRYLFRMADGMPVVTPPAQIDTTMAGRLRAILLEWHRRGYTAVVVDMTGGRNAGIRRITQWPWRPVCEPALAPFPPRGQAWELARYRAYQAHLAGHTIGETVGRAVTFLTLTGADAVSSPAVSADRWR
jgi:hypothetical protein